MIENYLGLEPLITERLRERVQGLRAVLGATEWEAIDKLAPPAPCAYVLYAGDAVGPEGRGENIAQRWGVVVVVSNAADMISGAARRAEAGPLVTAVHKALTNWRASPDYRPLKRVTGPAASYSGGFAHFPLGFEAEIVAIGTTEDEEL